MPSALPKFRNHLIPSSPGLGGRGDLFFGGEGVFCGSSNSKQLFFNSVLMF